MKADSVVVADAAATADRAKCMTQPALTAVSPARFRSSPWRGARCTAGTASPSTANSND